MSDELRHQQQAASIEQKINELVQQSRVLEAYLNDNISRQATVTRLLEEARLASNAIENVPTDSEIESFMPVGIGVYIKALVPPVKKLLINIGADVTIEKSKEDSINYIESKIKEFEVALRQLVSQKEQISMRMEQIQAQVNQMLQKGASVTGTTSDSSQSSHHNQQRSRDAGHPDHRPHRARARVRPREGAGGGMRRISRQTLRAASGGGRGTAVPRARQWVVTHPRES